MAHQEKNITFKDTGTDTFNTSDYAPVIPVELRAGSDESPADVPFDDPPVEHASSGPIRDDWSIMLGRLKHMYKLTHKRFNGDWILIKQEYEGYKKE